MVKLKLNIIYYEISKRFTTTNKCLFGPTWEFLHSLLDSISEFTQHVAGLNGVVFI